MLDLAGAAKSALGHSNPPPQNRNLAVSTYCSSKYPVGLLGLVMGHSWLLAQDWHRFLVSPVLGKPRERVASGES
jgi:hypothetical protein